MKENIIKKKNFEFGKKVVRICIQIEEGAKEYVLSKQLKKVGRLTGEAEIFKGVEAQLFAKDDLPFFGKLITLDGLLWKGDGAQPPVSIDVPIFDGVS